MGYIRNRLERITVTFNNNKINLPGVDMNKLEDKIKMVNKERTIIISPYA